MSLLETSALYKLFTYLLTYLLTYLKISVTKSTVCVCHQSTAQEWKFVESLNFIEVPHNTQFTMLFKGLYRVCYMCLVGQ